MVALALRRCVQRAIVAPGPADGEIMVELRDEIIVEIGGHAALVVADIAGDAAVGGVDLHHRPAGIGVEQDMRLVGGGEGEAKLRRAIGRRDFRGDVIVGQIDLVAVGPALLRLVAEPGCALLFLDLDRAGFGEQGEGGIIPHPGAGLMRLLDAVQLVRVIGIAPAIAHFSGHGRPEVHAPGDGDCGIGVAIGQFEAGIGAHQGIGEIDQRRRGRFGCRLAARDRPDRQQRSPQGQPNDAAHAPCSHDHPLLSHFFGAF